MRRGPLAEITVTGFIAVASSGASGTSGAATEASGRSPSTATAVRGQPAADSMQIGRAHV